MAKTYRSEACAVVHEIAAGLCEDGLIDQAGMVEFDELCLVKAEELTPEEIRHIRENVNLSQPVFAHYLNVPKDLVAEWETGVSKPVGPALKLLAIVKSKGLDGLAV